MRPDHYTSLDGVLDEALRLFGDGVGNRHSSFHTPVISTTGLEGEPRSRVVVLRAFDGSQRSLRFHTDKRSTKFAELTCDPRIAVLGYEPSAKAQVRLEGRAMLHTDDAFTDAAWDASRAMSRVCYGIAPGPGTPLQEPDAFTLPEETATDEGRAHFCAVEILFHRLEWLYLARKGHRRALFTWEGETLQARWLAP